MAASAAAMAAQPLRRMPQISAPVLFNSTRIFSLYSRQLLLPAVSAALPAINLNIPAWLGGIWESILRAVPKKKTSHSKKRHRQMAGKALKDIKLCNCPACGQPKRQHVVCANCLSSKIPHPTSPLKIRTDERR
ncbi:54S ribosomal protein L32, mitochondrial [Colletotrichum musicola]|uniref:Large ribosomal subunit protein bL32m n=1 Tax=Colletotrichum musicola TaxID=2175873 RepID=A0A8H6U8G7_9PEZI|nr:54S ribosomal protein L32, mitochondrial [Colletotrichum musicola]